MHIQDLITEEAKKFIKELNGEEFTIAHYRVIMFGRCSSLMRYRVKKATLTNYVGHPSVQLRGVGTNGVIMDKQLKEAEYEVEFWEKEALKALNE